MAQTNTCLPAGRKKKAFYLSSAVIIAIMSVFLFNYPPQQVKALDVVNCDSGTPLDQTALNALSGDVQFSTGAGDDICIFTGTLYANSVIVDFGVTLTHNAADTTGVNITTTEDFTLNGNINADQKGYAGGIANTSGTGTGAGTAHNFTGGGASHAGVGGNGSSSTTNGSTTLYGSAWDQGAGAGPATLGSGGGGGYLTIGGDGGGLVQLIVGGTLVVDGDISADAEAGQDDGNGSGGGGAGGAINIITNALSGSGTYSVDGGNGGNGTGRDAGGGGGGYIYMQYTSTDIVTPASTFENKVSAMGGSVDNSHSLEPSGVAYPGDNGSVIIVDKASLADLTDSDTYIYDGVLFKSGEENGTLKFQFNNLYIKGTTVSTDDVNLVTTNSAAYVDVDNILTMSNATWACSGASTLQIDASIVDINTLTSDDTFGVSGCGDWTFNVATTLASPLDNLTVSTDTIDWNFPAGNDLVITDSSITTTDRTVDTFTIDDALDISLGSADSTNPSDVYANVNWEIDSLTIYQGSSIDVTGLGYLGATTANTDGDGDGGGGGQLNNCGNGAGHGGAGGLCSDPGVELVGPAYDTSPPTKIGSGGGSAHSATATAGNGGDGGGMININALAGNLTLNGSLIANGGNGTFSGTNNGGGGGSGGSVYLRTGSFVSGASSSLTTTGGLGGNGSSRQGGSGGGGIVYIGYAAETGDLIDNLAAATNAAGGAAVVGGAAGSNGIAATLAYTAPTEPTITAPSGGATGVSRTPAITSSAYASNGASHTAATWQIDDANDFISPDWVSVDDASNLESITAQSGTGSFQNSLAGQTKLAPNTTYYLRVTHTNSTGSSNPSLSVSFTTTANNVPNTPSNITPADATTDQSKTLTLASSIYSDTDSDTHSDSSWEIFESSDCSGDAVWSSMEDSTNKETIALSSGTFAGTHAGQTELKGHTQYSWTVRHDDFYNGESSDSTCTSTTTLNAIPTADAGSDQTVTEGTDVTLTATSTDGDWNDTLTNTWIESLDSSDGCSLSGTTVTTSDKETSYTCQFQVEADDGEGTTDTDTMTLTITADNDAPTMGTIADVEVDEENVLVVAVSTADADTSFLTLAASSLPTGAIFTDNSDTTGNLQWTPTSEQSGEYAITFSVSDGTTTTIQEVTITVNDTVQDEEEGDDEEEEEPVNDIEDIGLISGSESGPGIVTLYDNSNVELCSVQAWSEGGAVPFTVRFLNTNYVAVVKNKTGSTIHLYDLNCNIVEKKRLSPKLHPRNIVTRNFIGKSASQEIGLTSRRGSTVYGKIFRYNPTKDKWYLLRQKTFRPVPTGYNLKKTKKGNILIKKNNKTLHKWEI